LYTHPEGTVFEDYQADREFKTTYARREALSGSILFVVWIFLTLTGTITIGFFVGLAKLLVCP